MKALAIAASQGQKIYTLNTKNQAYHATIIANLNTAADVKGEIINALYAGKEVTVHQSDITANGWTGAGYIILDTDTGAGAYKISGGTNGSATPSCVSLVVVVIAVVLVAAIVAVILIPFIIEGLAALATLGSSLSTAISVFVASFLAGFSTVANAGQGTGGSGGILCGREAECKAKLDEDNTLCVAIAGPRYGPAGISICQSSAIQRYSECLRSGVNGIRTPLAGVQTPI